MCSPPAIGSPGEPQVKLDQLFEKMLPAFIKIFKPSVPKFSGDPLKYSKFKDAFRVEMDKKDVYDATEKLKFLFCAVEGNAKSCFAKFKPGSDKYMEAWTAVDERFGHVDTVVSAAKRRVDQFPVILPKKPDRLRRVYDASAKIRGQSLNDKMYTGPDYLSLFGVLLWFCEGRIAFTADVREMYHMLRLPKTDQSAIRFLWRESSNEKPSVYQFQRTLL